MFERFPRKFQGFDDIMSDFPRKLWYLGGFGEDCVLDAGKIPRNFCDF